MKIEKIKELYDMLQKEGLSTIACLGIFSEIQEYQNDLNPETMEELIEMSIDLYYNTDYSTSTGIGVVLRSRIQDYLEGDITLEELLDREIFKQKYFWSDWQ